ncbi:unnamed protein product [Allacma fusca]|uniref:Ig-like domain-containing protein n=1 Tax=Allacma fusca TaxID=39272 RepID=A0A8J2KRC9_9HEXA|nr:unnamed protein product [Allacma fusca]
MNLFSSLAKPIPVIHVEGVQGTKGTLPCDVRVPSKNDKLHMVLWFRDKDGEPIYRYDVRDRPLTDPKRWSAWGDRIYFQTMSEPQAHLFMSELRLEDEGVYRCRVDFKNSPTRNLRINLTIIVPPEKPVIFDSKRNVVTDLVGPIEEDSDLLLTCEVSGGRPKPKVTWWLENAIIDDTDSERTSDGVKHNLLHYHKIQRHQLFSKFVCQASNTKHAPPRFAEARIDLYLRPLSTTITTKDKHLLAEKRYEIECISTGSRPPATITWWKHLRPITKFPDLTHSEDKNVTRSTISLTPTIEDDGKLLTCRSENHMIENSFQEDRYRLNVQYAPKVILTLGANLNPDDIKEGDDVYFECTIKSNPPYNRLSWFHDGREIRPNPAQKIVWSNTRLILQQVKRHNAGNYTCNAVNSEGSSQSNIVNLRVKFVPTCKSNSEELIGAMRHETVTVRCEMASDPPLVQFHWTFNNSGVEVIHVPQARFTSHGTVSLYNYTPTSELDYGTLACWGVNKIGKGEKGPCYFQIVSAGKPHPPKNCSTFNETVDSMSVSCVEGFNGGLPQHFLLEVVDFMAKKIKLNASSRIPLFSVENMEPGVEFRFLIFAINSKGRSEPFILDGITFNGVAKFTGPTQPAEVNPLFAILVGCSVVLIIFLVVLIVAVWKRARRKKPPVVKAFRRDDENTFQPTEAAITKIDQNGIEEIGNPDVVPNKNGRTGGIRGFIRIHKTPPARRRKKDVEIKNNGQIKPLTDAQDIEFQRNHHSHSSTLNNHKILTAALLPPKESRI